MDQLENLYTEAYSSTLRESALLLVQENVDDPTWLKNYLKMIGQDEAVSSISPHHGAPIAWEQGTGKDAVMNWLGNTPTPKRKVSGMAWKPSGLDHPTNNPLGGPSHSGRSGIEYLNSIMDKMFGKSEPFEPLKDTNRQNPPGEVANAAKLGKLGQAIMLAKAAVVLTPIAIRLVSSLAGWFKNRNRFKPPLEKMTDEELSQLEAIRKAEPGRQGVAKRRWEAELEAFVNKMKNKYR